ncbi:MAG: hypothetical protein R3F59_04605 [Myxococcota bacterium]
MQSSAGKVAEVTLAFWVMKICATTVGETAGDLLSMTLDLGYGPSSALLLGLFALSLALQLRARAFHPLLYWTVILTTSTAGTTLSDFLDRSVGLGYLTGAALLASLLVVVLLAWRWTLGGLAVDNVRSVRAESFYWTAILVSNTLGTALGDYLADDLQLGFAAGTGLIGTAIAVTALLALTTRTSRVALFWIAFVLTRPFGATFGDLMTKPVAAGGLALGTAGSTAVLLGLLLAVMAATYLRPAQPRPQ